MKPWEQRWANPGRAHLLLWLAFIAIAMLCIFVADTFTRYEIAAAVFYSVVVLIGTRALRPRGLILLSVVSIGMTVLSFACSPHGDYRSGLINTGINVAAILMTTFLAIEMQASRRAAQEAQAKLLRLARVKSLESLTTSIAHEVNQPLAAIVASGSACQRWLAQEPANLDKARQALARVLNDAGRASTIIARMRSLARGGPPHKSDFEFSTAALEVVALSRGEIRRKEIRLSTDFGVGLPLIRADQVQIQQVLGNLILNAMESLESVPVASRSIRISAVLEGRFIVCTVADSGLGIPAGVYPHLFETFWTTKTQGVGVGLSISRTLIEANGGQIWAEPIEDGGAVFRFRLPVILGSDPHANNV